MQISQSVKKVNNITTEIAHTSEEQSSAAADSMRSQTQEMEEAANFFKVKSGEMEHVVNFGASISGEYQVSEKDTQRARGALRNSNCLGLSRAINAHRSFVSKIHSMVESGRDIAESLPTHKECEFGQWIVQDGKKCVPDQASYARLLSEHEAPQATRPTTVKSPERSKTPEGADWEEF